MEFPAFRALVERARSGDRRSQEEILQALRPFLLAEARKYDDPGHAEASVSDLVQESELRIWQRLGQFAGDREASSDEAALAAFRSWCAQIVRSLGLNAIRDRRSKKRQPEHGAILPLAGQAGASSVAAHPGRQPRELPADPQSSPSSIVRGDEKAQLVRDAIDAIADPEVREVLRLSIFEEKPLSAIAEGSGLSFGQARERYRQGMRELERRLGRLLR